MTDPMHAHVCFLLPSDLPGSNDPSRVEPAIRASGFASVLLSQGFRARTTVESLRVLCGRLRSDGRVVGAHVAPPASGDHLAWITAERRTLLRLELLKQLVYADGAERYAPNGAESAGAVSSIGAYLDKLEFPRVPSDLPYALRMSSAWWQCSHRLSGGPACLDPPKVYDAGPAEFTSAMLDYLGVLDSRLRAFRLLYPGAPLAALYGWVGRIMGPTDRLSRALGVQLIGEAFKRARLGSALVVWQTDTEGLIEDAAHLRAAMEARP